MTIQNILQEGVVKAVKALYELDFPAEKVTLSTTRKEFDGDYTVVVFPFTKAARKKPDVIGEEIGAYLKEHVGEVADFNVVKGFLNLSISEAFWKGFLQDIADKTNFGQHERNGRKVMVEFSSPNTNKPLHLGHIRNILLGWSVSKMYKAAGYEVINTQIVNDRGIAICKTMLAWELFGNGETPESSGMKGDHFVGKYYVKFASESKTEYQAWQQTDEAKAVFAEKAKEGQDEATFFDGYKNDYFNEYSKLGAQAKEMLVKWEAGDADTIALWQKMKDWVLEGFDKTYDALGVDFDKLYFESDTYLLGKEIIQKGLDEGVLTKEGKRVWIDLDNIGLAKKTILKSDGTSTYTSQDLGTAQMRYKEYGAERCVYVVGDEQNAHFAGVFEILKRLGESYAEGLYHLSYGMVDLPTGRMKSREGTVVDADDLIQEVINTAAESTKERGELDSLSPEAQQEIVRRIGVGALKYFIIRVDPKKRMVFNPEDSLDMQGQTGPYVQNAYVRIQSVLRKAGEVDTSIVNSYENIKEGEKSILNQLYSFPELISEAAESYNPSAIANFSYTLAKSYHKFYHDHPIIKAESEAAKAFRIQLSKSVANVLEFGMELLGIQMPERM